MKLFIKKYLQISRLPFFWATFQHFTTVTIGSGLALTRFQAQRKFQGRKSWLLRELNGALMLCWFLGTSVWAPSVNTAFPFFLLHLCTIFTLYYLHETKKTMSQWSILDPFLILENNFSNFSLQRQHLHFYPTTTASSWWFSYSHYLSTGQFTNIVGRE